MKRSFQSGAQKRKKARKEEMLIEKLPRMTSFFDKISNGDVDSNYSPTSSNISKPLPENENTLPPASSSLSPVLSNDHSHEHDEDKRCYNKPEQNTDPALWESFQGCKSELQEFWIRKGPSCCQNLDSDFSESVRKYESLQDGKKVTESRKLRPSMFYKELQNGEKVKRDWLLYSPSTGRVYCFVCKLFGSMSSNTFSSEGFNDWKHALQAISGHENGNEHRKYLLAYLKRCKEVGRIDTALEIEVNKERDYWREVLKRIVSVVRFLSERGLPFRGSEEKFGCRNNGNYLGSLELLAEYDPFLKEHIHKYGSIGTGNVSYLSSSICDEFVELMGEKVRQQILSEIKESKYYSISVDSTPDIGHTDQLTFTIRYVRNNAPVERFLKFIPIHGHSAESLFEEVTNVLNNNKIPLSDCRGQSYDNASNMSGRYTGLQARIREENPLAEFIPCAAHSLNLVGVVSAENNIEALKLFDFIQTLYNFFSSSTSRWNILSSNLANPRKKVVKSLSNTRWSARADAVLALKNGYVEIGHALDSIINDMEQPADTRLKATGLKKCMQRFETVFLIHFWSDILTRINKVSKLLQKSTLTLSVLVKILDSLAAYIKTKRDSFEQYERLALEITGISSNQYSQGRISKRSSRLQFFDNKNTEDIVLKGRDKLRVDTYIPIIDSLVLNLKLRSEAYKNVFSNFGFFEDLANIQQEHLKMSCENFASVYKKDVIQSELFEECVHMKSYLQETVHNNDIFHKEEYDFDDKENTEAECKTGEEHIIVPHVDDINENEEVKDDEDQLKNRLQVDNAKKLNLKMFYCHLSENGLFPAFPNIEISLRIFLSMMVSNASGERSFSKLKIIKSAVRSTMKQERLNTLSVLSIENDLLRNIDFSEVIDDFASKKCRKMFF